MSETGTDVRLSLLLAKCFEMHNVTEILSVVSIKCNLHFLGDSKRDRDTLQWVQKEVRPG